MQLAFNYSREAAALLEAGAIALDRWKCPPWPNLITEARQTLPVYVHFDLYAGGGQMDTVSWDVIERLLDSTGTPFVNLHLTPTLDDFGFAAEPLTDIQRAQVIETMIGDVQFVARRFGPERVIVENIPYRGQREANGWHFLRPAVEPAVFAQVLEATGAGMLFDIAHATITADTLGLDAQSYIAAHPLGKLHELHVAGVQPHSGALEDHLAMSKLDWHLLEFALGKVAEGHASVPWIVACEYGGLGPNFAWRSEADVIADHAPRLRRMLDAVSLPEKPDAIYPASAQSRS
ncbi:MAG TPA: DUF692 family protein [Candidatus Limnocylindrales bacterium]|nr:DUF692 family protein [Candidatus Limnocylindrales bacterium]